VIIHPAPTAGEKLQKHFYPTIFHYIPAANAGRNIAMNAEMEMELFAPSVEPKNTQITIKYTLNNEPLKFFIMKLNLRLLKVFMILVAFLVGNFAFAQQKQVLTEKQKMAKERAIKVADQASDVSSLPKTSQVYSKKSHAFVDFSQKSTRGLLIDNGPFVTNPGGGPNGSDVSLLETPNTSYGSNCNNALGYAVAEDFSVIGTWSIDSLAFFGYQTSSSTTSTFTGLYVQIWNGNPSLATSSVVWGDLTTNILTSTRWSGCYRATDLVNTDRPIMRNVAATPGLVLPAGDYWIVWTATGSLSSGPWANAITISGQPATGNAKQYTGSAWADILDGTNPQGMPFMVYGAAGNLPTNDIAMKAILTPISGPNMTSTEVVSVRIQNNGTATQLNIPVSYTVNGGTAVNEVVAGPIAAGAYIDYTFTQTADLSVVQSYEIVATATLTGDENPNNNSKTKNVTNFGNLVLMQDGTVTTCSGTFYDTGGPNGTYQCNEDITMTIAPSTPGAKMKFNFTAFDCEDGWDFLKVYDGADVNAPMIGNFTGATIPAELVELIASQTNTSGAITFHFTSDNSVMHLGWAATMSCVVSANQDLAGVSVTGNAAPVINTATTYTVTVANSGAQAVTGANYTVTLYDAANTVIGTANGVDIAAGESKTFDFSWTPTTLGATHLYGKVVLTGDENPANDQTPNFNVNVTQGGSNLPIYATDFESFTAGGQVACQDPTHWTTWSNAPCGTEDAYISTDFVHSGANAVKDELANDQVLDFGNKTTGKYEFSFWMYIPSGHGGYYNVLHNFAGSSSEWGMEFFFYDADTASLHAGGQIISLPSYNHDTWFKVTNIIDLDNDLAEVLLDGVSVHSWQWSLDPTTGEPGLNQLSASDFFSGTGTTGLTPLYYFDDVEYKEASPVTPPIYANDFESFTAGGQVACQDPIHWTTWSNTPCSPTKDAYISTDFAQSGANSIIDEGVNDLVLNMGNKTTGKYEYNFSIYIPSDFCGYYGVLQDFAGSSSKWGLEVYFHTDGTGLVNADGNNATSFTYVHNQWIPIKNIIDLDNDLAELIINGVSVYLWQWSLGATGTGGVNQLSASDFFASADANFPTDVPKYYLDDIDYKEVGAPAGPHIAVTPTSLSQDLLPNATATQTLHIANTGAGDLNFNIDVTYPAKSVKIINHNAQYERVIEKIPAKGGKVLVDFPTSKKLPEVIDYATITKSTTNVNKHIEKFGRATVLYDQTANPSAEGGIASQTFPDAPTYSCACADDFTVPSGSTWTVGHVYVAGTYKAGALGVVPAVNVVFYNDASGVPGTAVATFTAIPAQSDATGNVNIFLTSPVTLTAGNYWVSVAANMANGTYSQWFWAKQSAPTIQNEFQWTNPSTGFTSSCIAWCSASVQWPDQLDKNLSFALTGSTQAPPPTGWLTANPLSGIVPAGGNVDIQVTFDATGLSLGTYNGNLAVSSNDPAHPVTNVPVTLNVHNDPQTTLTIATVTGVEIGSAISVPVHATLVNNMGSFQFSIEYNPALMTYTGTSNWHTGIDAVSVGNPSPGHLTFVWAAETEGVNIPDGNFFNIDFTWNGGANQTSTVVWSDNPTPREFADYNGIIFFPTYVNGSISGNTTPQPILSVTPANQNVTSTAGTTSFAVTNTGTGSMSYSAVVTTGNDWLSISSGSTGGNNGIIVTAYSQNNSSTSRVGIITITAPGAIGSPKQVTVTQAITPPSQIERNLVIVELSTGTWCQYDPGAAMGVNDLAANGCEIGAIAYHNSDPFANNASNARNTYYNITGYPTAHFDGVLEVVGGDHTQSMYASYLPKYNQRIAVPSSFKINLTFSHVGNNYTVNAQVIKLASYTGSNLVFQLALTESDIIYSWQGQSQLNFVERLMVPDQNGTALDFSTSDTINLMETFTMNSSWAPENCELVAFIQDNSSKEIMQSIKRRLYNPPTLSIATIDIVQPGPVSVPVHAANIVNMGSFQFSIEYDPALLTYTGTSNWYSGMNAVTVGNPSPGNLTFVWASEFGGINIPDGNFFNIDFTWNGGVNQTSTIVWSDNPTPREFSDYNGVIFTPTYINGSVTSGNTLQPILSVAPANQIVTYTSGNTSFNVSNTGTGTMTYSATVTTGSNWLSITSGATGGNSGAIAIAYTENTSNTPRTGTITVTAPDAIGSPVQVNITQTAYNPQSTPTLTIATLTGVVPGVVVVPVHANYINDLGAFQFTIEYDPAVLTYINTSNWYSGITAVTIGNPTPGKLTFMWATDYPINIADGTFFKLNFNYISGATAINWSNNPIPCEFSDWDGNIFVPVYNNGGVNHASLSVTPANQNVPYTSGNTNFNVTNTGTGTMTYTAQVTSGGNWLTITGGATGGNTGTITTAYLQNNTADSRVGTITITAPGATGSPKQVTVTQAGIQPVLSVTPTNQNVPYTSGNTNFNVANIGTGTMTYTAQVTSGGNWLTITGGATGGNTGTITIGYLQNNSTMPRVGTITVTAPGAIGNSKQVTVTQAGTQYSFPVLTIGTVSASNLVPVIVPISASNFFNLGSFQFSISYDATKLTYVKDTNWYVGITAVTINSAIPGKVSFVWAADGSGLNICDNVFFDLKFNAIDYGQSIIAWADDPTPREFGDWDGNIITPTYNDGNIVIGENYPVLSVTPTNQNVPYTSGNTNFNVANVGTGTMTYTTQITSGGDWLTITGGATGGNTGTITTGYLQNNSTMPRVGTITITATGATGSPKQVTVNKKQTPPVLSVTPTNQNVPYTSGNTNFNVTNTGTGTMTYTAQVTSGGNWLTITGGATGGNSGTIVVSYLQNNSTDSRVGTIIITAPGATGSPQTVTVTQAGITPTHFTFEGGNPADPVWTIYLSQATLDDMDLQPLDEIAVFDSTTMVGAYRLTEVLTPGNVTDNYITAFKTLTNRPGYTPGHHYSFKCWDVSAQTEINYANVSLLNPWGDAYTGNVFPENDGEYSIADIDFLTAITHSYNLNTGYQFISSYITPPNVEMTVVLADLLNSNLSFVRSSTGNMLRKLGPGWVNNIGNWVITEGYLVKMNAPDDFSIIGTPVDPLTPITLNTGYQFISYFHDYPMNASAAFAGILNNNLSFIRNSGGNMLRKLGPNWVNNIGNVVPGEGYLAKMNAPDILVYPADKKSIANNLKLSAQHFIFEGGNAADPVYTIYVSDASINGYTLQAGDEIGVFDGGILVGSLALTQSPTIENQFDNSIAVFSTLNSGQGYIANHLISFKVWSAAQGIEYDAVSFSFSNPYGDAYTGNVYPNSDGVYSIVSLSESLTGTGNTVSLSNLMSVYPNPFSKVTTIEFNLTSISKVKLLVYNAIGEQVAIISDKEWGTGKHELLFDASILPQGLYNLRMDVSNNATTLTQLKRIVIVR